MAPAGSADNRKLLMSASWCCPVPSSRTVFSYLRVSVCTPPPNLSPFLTNKQASSLPLLL